MRLAIGTAQFGLSYGVANTRGRIPVHDVAVMLAEARVAGCDTLDTAIGYGDAEQVLGHVGLDGWRVITKLPAVPSDCADVGAWVDAQLDASCARLGRTHVDGVLLHAPAQLSDPVGPVLYGALQGAKDRGRAKAIGVSIYAPEELDVMMTRYTFDLVQGPFNPLDRRWLDSGWLDRLCGMGVECHARSVFLQGLLVMAPGARPAWTTAWPETFAAYDAWVAATGRTAVEACLAFVLGHAQFSRVVVGADGPDHLRTLLAIASSAAVPPAPDFGSGPGALITPSSWRTGA